jgi:hypothetical protein
MRYIIKIDYLVPMWKFFMRLLTLIALTLSLVTLPPAAAQDTSPAPWPPENPQALFGPEVEIISTEMGSSQFVNGIFYSDDEARVLHIWSWGVYPFPYGFIKAAALYELPDNRYYIKDYDWDDDEAPAWWLLDLKTAEWLKLRDQPQQVQTRCGSIPFNEDQRSYVESRVMIVGSNREIYFCDLASGIRTPAARPPGDAPFEANPISVIEFQESNSDTPQVNCEVRWQHADSLQWTMYTLPSSCQFERTVDDDHFYYRTVSSDRTTARLMAADKLTGESRLVYAGEIEAMDWLSPDARYAALVIGSDNYIDNLPGQRGGIYFSEGAELWLIDLVDDRILLKTPAYECISLSPLWCPWVKPLTDDLVALRTSVGYPVVDLFSLFSLSQGTMTASDIDGRLGSLFTGDWAFLYGAAQDESGTADEMDIYNVTTLQRVDLAAVATEPDYSLSHFIYLGDGYFRISIRYDIEWTGKGENPLYDVVAYRIRVNAPGL